MNFILIAGGLWLFPGPRMYYRKYILGRITTQNNSSKFRSMSKVEVNFPSIIVGLSIACALINATLRSGQGISASYDLAVSVQSQQLSSRINHILRPLSGEDKSLTETVGKDISKVIDNSAISSVGNYAQQRLLETIQSQLHVYYELAIIRGANLQTTLSAMSDRMQTEFVNLSIIEAEKSAIKLAGPLTLCFLPAFILLSLIPTIISLADSLLGGVL